MPVFQNETHRAFPARLGLSTFTAMAWLQSLFRELKSYKPAAQPQKKKKKKKDTQISGAELRAQK